ncbi:hypothetical protein SBOR_5661 [Sclerotinia borealis F-4128]|uniref:Zn(2)-C6 fungal-type domain-containing protein n=1 Tax=Sclerotinia borealis (strain F-4128) TaxID=1432307 RepID=W9CDN7_SCLBF|nr:hypothetical protein SBOR_5661 [Sclerotinia borealis F-4128]
MRNNKILPPTSSGSQRTPPTANIPSPHSLAAILSPSAPPDSDSAVGVSRSSSPKRSHAEAFSATDPTYLHPASPKQHRPNITSAGVTSPGALGASGLGADDGNGGGRGGIEEKKPTKMVRSSIACARCRRSKVKCVNNGVNSICRACESSNRECTYPSAAASTPKRPDPPTGIKIEGESDNKKRVRKHEDSGRRNSQRAGEEPLEASILTRKVWDEIYDIFKLNFSTEMPFLHPPSFRNRMRQASHPRDPSTLVDIPAFQDAKILLLGVLTLTARFHPELIAYHAPANSPRPNDPLAASDYYATALTSTIFGASGKDLSTPTTERIQALLMLGLYEWGQTRGLSAWVYVGIATRLAQAMGLPYEDDPSARTFKTETAVTASSTSYRPEVNKHPARDTAIEKEVRRRTFWSCFIMDRMLSAGKARPTMIESSILRVQLPCSDDQFLFTQSVQTGYLNREFEQVTLTNAKIQEGGVLGRYCRLVEIWGKLSKWSLHGGRRTESLPPWDESTQFYKLSHELEDFYSGLPENLTFSEDNLNAHLEKRNATTYASLHTLVSLCRIMLHREYIPFIPLRADKPSGPLDEPTFPKEKFDIPPGFWEQSADSLFSSARDIVDIMRTCQDNNALPESPLFVFALFHSAFTGVYSVHFSQMDPNEYMGESRSALPIKILKEMVPRLTMARFYHKKIEQMVSYYRKVKNEFKRYKKDVSWKGGGLEEWKGFEKDLKEFGSLEDAAGGDSHSDDYPNRSRCSTSDLGSTTAANSNSEPMQGVEGTGSRPAAWAPINAANPNINLEMQQGPGGPYIPSGAYQPSPNQNSNPPSLISPGNGDSASSINSPYSNQGQAQSYPQLQQMGPYHPPMTHQPHNMAPPGTQAGWNRDPTAATTLPYATWIDDLESISMNTYNMENFTQSFGDASQSWNAAQFGAPPQTNWVAAVERNTVPNEINGECIRWRRSMNEIILLINVSYLEGMEWGSGELAARNDLNLLHDGLGGFDRIMLSV